jgi:hypothetical protein
MTNNPVSTLTNMARQLLTSQSGVVVDRNAVENAVRAVAPVVAATTGHTFGDFALSKASSLSNRVPRSA